MRVESDVGTRRTTWVRWFRCSSGTRRNSNSSWIQGVGSGVPESAPKVVPVTAFRPMAWVVSGESFWEGMIWIVTKRSGDGRIPNKVPGSIATRIRSPSVTLAEMTSRGARHAGLG